MNVRSNRSTPTAALWRGLTWCAAALAGLGAATVGAVLAVFFAAAMMVIAVMASALLALAGVAARARRRVRARMADSSVIEARHVGGHHWVAYGWDGPR
jgi:hypothetical protein